MGEPNWTKSIGYLKKRINTNHKDNNNEPDLLYRRPAFRPCQYLETFAQSTDLRFDVGIDGKLAGLRFLTLEEIYNAAMEKITSSNCNSFEEYVKNNYRGEVR